MCNRLPDTAGPVVAGRVRHDPRIAADRTPVTHDRAVISFCTGGRSRVEQRGAWRIAEGDVLLVPAGEAHRTLDQEQPEAWGVAFSVPCFVADGAVGLLDPLERVRDGASPVVSIPAARHTFLAGIFAELESVVDGPQARHATTEAVQRSLLTLILAEVARATALPKVPRVAAGGVVAEALRFIEHNCLRRLSLHDVAAAVGRSPAYVTTALTQATGRSAGAWIVAGRMAQARRLLLHSDARVEVVAERVGYADPTHFIRMFRRAFGATPAAWRAAQLHDAA